jgi:hypothetical protein
MCILFRRSDNVWQGAPLLTSTLIMRPGGGEVLEERPRCTHCDKMRRPQNRINISSGQRQTRVHIRKQRVLKQIHLDFLNLRCLYKWD